MATQVRYSHNDATLTQLGNAYIAFLEKAGQAKDSSFENDVPSLFSQVCKKIVNNVTVVEASSKLGEYLWKAQEVFGKWKIHQGFSVLSSPFMRSITITYIVEATPVKLLVIAILKINEEDGKINEIFEVDHSLN